MPVVILQIDYIMHYKHKPDKTGCIYKFCKKKDKVIRKAG